MKKLLVLLTLLLLVASCTKEIEVSSSGDTSGEAVNFTASVVDVTQTKATLINSWSGGEQVALFVGETLYWYTIAEDGTMSGDEVIVDREASITYTAFYPYDPDLSTIAEYESACTAGNVDYMSATTTTSGKAVELQFSHKMAALSFTIFIEGTVTDPAISLALDGDFNSAIALEVDASISAAASRLTANYFLAAGTDISEAMIKLEQSGSTSIHSIKREESNTLEVGKQYPFSYTIGDLPTGSGVEGDPYIVYTADDMRKVGTEPEGWALNSHYLLAWDIDLENIEFTPIGAESYSMIFKGTFDGGGHQISGLYINQQSNDYQGLFGYISGATIKNLGVSGSVTGCSRVGGVAGYANWSKVDNCYFTGSVKGYSSHIGGVAGYIYQQSTVNNCYNTGSVEGVYYVGGVVGYNFSQSYVTDCYNTGSVEGSSYVGGVVGCNTIDSNPSALSQVNNCYNIGSIVATSSVGGVVGKNSETCIVNYCYYDYSVVGDIGAVDSANSGTNYCGLSTEMIKGAASTSGTLLYYFNQGGSDAWVADDAVNPINNGYPILKWQTSNN